MEAVCFQLGISRGKLSALTKEALGISAGELLDGFKIRGLRRMLIAQLRMAADALWDAPGEFAKRRCMSRAETETGGRGDEGDGDGGRFARGPAGRRRYGRQDAGATKRSRYFRTRPAEFLGLEHGEEERLRLSELLGKLDAQREENDFRIEAFATLLGFESAADFKKACLNVMGRTMAQLERILAREVVAYYLAAEDRVLREICFRDDELGFRAREIYCGDAEICPTEPYLDRWSAHEFGTPKWLERMGNEFG